MLHINLYNFHSFSPFGGFFFLSTGSGTDLELVYQSSTDKHIAENLY